MTHYLVVYRRSTGELITLDDLGPDHRRAVARRFEVERRERRDPDVEVVLLSAASKDALMHTHARYFKSVPELAADLAAGVAAATS